MVSKMKQYFAFLFCIVLPVTICAAKKKQKPPADYGYKITYEGSSIPAATSSTDAELHLDAEFAADVVQGQIRIRVVAGQIRLVNGKTEVARIPASSVTEISYGQDASRRVAVAIGLDPASFAPAARPLTPSKSKIRYIDIGVVWDDGVRKGGVAFQSDNGGVIRVNVNLGRTHVPGFVACARRHYWQEGR